MQALMERLNSSSQFLQSNDMRVTEVRHGFAKVEMIIDEQILNIHGFVHGGALFSLADTVAGAASGSLTLAHSRNSQMSFMYGFFFVKFLFLTVVCVVIVI